LNRHILKSYMAGNARRGFLCENNCLLAKKVSGNNGVRFVQLNVGRLDYNMGFERLAWCKIVGLKFEMWSYLIREI